MTRRRRRALRMRLERPSLRGSPAGPVGAAGPVEAADTFSGVPRRAAASRRIAPSDRRASAGPEALSVCSVSDASIGRTA